MGEGRYLLGVEPPEKSARFLDQVAGTSVEIEWLRDAADRARADRLAAGSLTQAELPCPSEFAEHIQRVRDRPLFNRLFGACEVDLALVDLASLVPVQPHVDFSFATRAVRQDLTQDGVFELCLPAKPQPVDAWGGLGEAAGQGGFTVCSPDLNLMVTEVHMDTEPHVKVSFTISKTAVFLVAVESRGRLFLKDGTHRAVGLLSHGWKAAPCVIVRGPGSCATLPEHLPEDTLFSDHPPHLGDFLNPSLHLKHPWRPGMKLIRIRADEFTIPSSEGAFG